VFTYATMTFALLDGYSKSNNDLGKMLNVMKDMNESCITPDIKVWNVIMEGYSRAVGEDDQKKALSIWRYLSGQQTHGSLGIDLPEKAPTVFPDAASLSIAFDIWEYGQVNNDVVLDANVLISYVEALASFGKKSAANEL
jgi:hypothetical protein